MHTNVFLEYSLLVDSRECTGLKLRRWSFVRKCRKTSRYAKFSMKMWGIVFQPANVSAWKDVFCSPLCTWTNTDVCSVILMLDNLLISCIDAAQNHILQLEKEAKTAASAQHIRTFMAPYLLPTLSYFLRHPLYKNVKSVGQENVNFSQTVCFSLAHILI